VQVALFQGSCSQAVSTFDNFILGDLRLPP